MDCVGKIDWISNTYKQTENQKMIKSLSKAYDANKIPDDASDMFAILKDRINVMMKFRNEFPKITITSLFFGKTFNYLNDQGKLHLSVENLRTLLVGADKEMKTKDIAVLDKLIMGRVAILKEFCDIGSNFSLDTPVKLTEDSNKTVLVATSKKIERKTPHVIPKKYKNVVGQLKKVDSKYQLPNFKVSLEILLKILDEKICPYCSTTNVNFRDYPCNKKY